MNTQSYILDTAKVRIILDTVFIHPSVRAEKAKSQRRKSEGTGYYLWRLSVITYDVHRGSVMGELRKSFDSPSRQNYIFWRNIVLRYARANVT